MTMFEVSNDGFRSLMVSKPKWHFVRELISNSLDESSVSTIELGLYREPRWLTIVCEDDGDGFERLSDAYTLFAHTKKRSDATVRGRFNMGEKELASISKEMMIETTTGKVVFKDGKRKDHPRTKLDRGTIVTAKISCNQSDWEELLVMVNMFIVPRGKEVLVVTESTTTGRDEYALMHHRPFASSEETLETTLFDPENGGMRPTKRKTKVGIYKEIGDGKQYFLYELGIPVQDIECKFNVNVNQKVPMNANRDSVKDSYLRDIYAIVLNATHDQLNANNVSDNWVTTASEDERTSNDAFTSVKNARFGEKSVKWSSDLQANEDARDQGYAVIHPKFMSPVLRDRMEGIGMVSSSKKFARSTVPYDHILKEDWTDSMKEFERLTFQICDLLKVNRVAVQFITSKASTIADYNIMGRIRFNLGHSHWGSSKKKRLNFDPMAVEHLDIIMHELGHMGSSLDYTHDSGFYHTVTKHSAKMVQILLYMENK